MKTIAIKYGLPLISVINDALDEWILNEERTKVYMDKQIHSYDTDSIVRTN